MSRWLKQSTSVDLPIGPFLDNADGFTALTALTITQPDVRLKKNGGAWAQKAAAQTLSHEENGWYEVTLDATDTDTLGQLMLNVSESGALPVWHEFMVVTANVWDSLYSTDALQVHAVEISNGLITAAAIATSAIDADALASDAVNEIRDAVFARAFAASAGSFTFDELTKLMAYVLLGKASGLATTTATYRNLADSADGIVATVDANGNRSAVTRTP